MTSKPSSIQPSAAAMSVLRWAGPTVSCGFCAMADTSEGLYARARLAFGRQVAGLARPEVPLCALHVARDLGAQRLHAGKPDLRTQPVQERKLHVALRRDLDGMKVQQVRLHREAGAVERGP